MSEQFAAFISYSHRYKPWVATLQRNLEAWLKAAGAAPWEVFLDQTDLSSGRSWVAQLQEGVARARHLILIATPEALASPRAADEWEGFISLHRDWAGGKLHVLQLVEVPLPPFLDRIQRLDFTDPESSAYSREIRKLTGALLGLGRRELPAPPAGLEGPPSLPPALPPKQRRQLVEWLAPQLEDKLLRVAVAGTLGIQLAAFAGHPTSRGAASAALVAATGDDDPVQAARRVVSALRETFEDRTEILAGLDSIAAQIRRLGDAAETGLLGAWLKRVARDHSNLVPFFENADLELLDRVYVQPELRPDVRLPRDQKETSFGLGDGPRTLRDLIDLDPQERPGITGRWVVRGDPGAGKTTLLRHLAAKLAKDPERRWVPIFESLPRLMRKSEWLLDRLEREMRRAGEAVQGLAATLDREGQEGRLLLLLDGLDEVPREEREEAEALLRQLSDRWPRTPLVVTSRPIGYRRPGSEFLELELLSFDDDQRRQFLERWFGRPTCVFRPGLAKVLETLRGEPGLWELAGNPLYLTLIALLFEGKKEPDRNRAKLYSQVFGLLLDGRHRPQGRPVEAKETVYEVLRRLAVDMTGDNRDAESRSELEARLLKEPYDPLCATLRRHPPWQHSLSAFLKDLAEQVGILGPHDGRSADWRFWHRTFREALAAERLAAELEAGGEAAVLDQARAVAGDESRWAEPFALLVSQVEQPDRLVLSLVEANRALGLRAVATAQRMSDETLRQVLQLTGGWEERSKVYDEIPDLVDDPERAVALVDQLRRRTRDGNDLFFLHEALVATGRRWPQAERIVDRARRRFFEHIPPPDDPKLLWILDSPLDGQVELWRRIPVGEGWVGSPEDEEGRDDDEGPRHKVEVLRPFCVGAGPVTNAQYAAFDPDKPFRNWEGVPEDELPFHPRVDVTWYEAVSFCRWLGALPSFKGTVPRLPEEEEWEYACRAGTMTPYWSGESEEDLGRVSWYEGNEDKRTHRVGEKPANEWGLYDMHGNVWEWMARPFEADRYKGRSAEKPHPIDPTAGSADLAGSPRVRRVVRGGSFWHSAQVCRSAYRYLRNPWSESWVRGFRVLLSSAPSRGSAVDL